MRPTFLSWTLSAMFVAGATVAAMSDDGAKVLKRMTGGSIDNQLTVLPGDVGAHVSEAEHAFTDMMPFYVPAQAASGAVLTEGIDYLDIDEALVENLTVAKPLVNVFIYGPAIGVPDTPFAHSYMDTFVGVSLDDGVTWKTTNLSQTADQSSFDLGSDGGKAHKPHGGGHDDDGDHHGADLNLKIGKAIWIAKDDDSGKLEVQGVTEPGIDVAIINYTTGAVLFETTSKDSNGLFKIKETMAASDLPCMVAAVIEDGTSAPVAVRTLNDDPVTCVGTDLTEYPGGTYNVFQATAGNMALVAWPSRFCQQGQPAYSFAYRGADKEADIKPELIDKRNAVVAQLGIDIHADLYLTDLFGVSGSQGSIDFEEEGYPQAGEVPFGCVWTARGMMLPGDDPRTGEIEASHMVWTKPERLTSGRRDPNRIEVKGVAGAGFVITWQEDPDGLRPGQGLGPGEGWSGAVAHSKTDIWYSFVPWEQFALVENPADPTGAPVNVVDHDLLLTGRPQVYVPMAVPMRLTNNDKCNTSRLDDANDEYFSYCNDAVAASYGFQNFCAARAEIPQGQTGTGEICINEDGLPNFANTGSTRPRLSLQGYDSDADGAIDSAWVIVAAEESKGLGRSTFLPDGTPCDEDAGDPDCTADIGKNQWYFSFDMADPATSATAAHPNGLVQNLVSQGNMLNQPEIDWRTGDFYPALGTNDIWTGSTNLPDFLIYNTEIARRSSLLVQSIAKANASSSRLVATPSWKQGAMRQGGPADTMLRRIVMPDGYVEGLDNNPYAFSNMVCTPVGGSPGWLVAPDTNPYYPGGICGAPATNLSGVVPDTCLDSDTGSATDCPKVDFTGSTFGVGDTNPILQGYIQGEGNTQKVLTWHQCPSDGVQSAGDFTAVTCDADERTDEFVNLADQSWYNPLDVSKGHRGFIDGDFVMFLYGWSPNWRLNAKGNDRYDLYVRRSFDGGATWSVLPQTFDASDGVQYSGDGTVTCETYRSTETQVPQAAEPRVCYDFAAGGAEHARNVTMHSRMRVTTLDPRYAPTRASIVATDNACLAAVPAEVDTSTWSCDDGSTEHDSDLRDPSRYFMVFETGDNSTVQAGEAEPLDLFYSRAESFGDDYVVWTETDTGMDDIVSTCYPSAPYEDPKVIGTPFENSGYCNEFDRMNAGGDTHSSEASLEGNPDGSKLYGVWTQWVFDESGEEISESDAMARRIWWIDLYRSTNPDLVWTIQGTNSSQ